MHRRAFLKTGIAGAVGHSLFPAELQAKIPKNLKVTALKVIPVWTGAAKKKIRLYIHGGSAEAVHRAKELGFSAVKTGPDLAVNGVIKQPFGVKSEIKRIRRMRAAAGDDFDILYDAHTQFRLYQVLEWICRAAARSGSRHRHRQRSGEETSGSSVCQDPRDVTVA